MPTQEENKENMLGRKIGLLLKFRDYHIEEEVEEKYFKDIIVVKRGEEGKILIRVIHSTPLASGKVGVHSVRRLRKKIEEGGYCRGILIGEGFSHSARTESRINGIEVIPEKRIPAFNIFDHHLVPNHEVLTKEETEELLRKYHVQPYQLPLIRASDPAAFLIGAKPGDILKVTRKSPTSGIYVTYRYVI